jgi:hypothetical protein
VARYKGRLSSKSIERDFPHIVEITVPAGGLGKQLDAMYDWHRERGVEVHRGGGRREEGRDIIGPVLTKPCVEAKLVLITA